MKVHDILFGQASDIDSYFEQAPYDGVLGLGYTTLAAGGVTPLLIDVFNQNLAFPMFTVRLTDAGGFITLGYVETQHCTSPDFDWEPLQSYTYYQFTVESFYFKGQQSYGEFW